MDQPNYTYKKGVGWIVGKPLQRTVNGFTIVAEDRVPKVGEFYYRLYDTETAESFLFKLRDDYFRERLYPTRPEECEDYFANPNHRFVTLVYCGPA